MPTLNEGSAGAESRTPPPGDALNALQDDAMALLDSAREHGAEHLEQYREGAADQLENLARSATSAAEELQENDTLGLSHYITDVADGLSTFAGSLRGKSADELLQQVGRLARENPALFVTGSVALGFGLSRFLRASSPDLSSAPPADSSDNNAKADDHEFDPRIAADEELAIRPAHEGDAVTSHSAWSRNPPPSDSATGDSAGIQQSGAELGSFNSDPGSRTGQAADSSPYTGASTNEPAPRGEP